MDEDMWILVIENIYKIIGHREDYINPTIDSELSQSSVNSYDTNSEDAMERCKNKLYRVLTRRCMHISI
jgi:hypothetical protein